MSSPGHAIEPKREGGAPIVQREESGDRGLPFCDSSQTPPPAPVPRACRYSVTSMATVWHRPTGWSRRDEANEIPLGRVDADREL